MKAAELKSPPAAEKRRNPQFTSRANIVKMHITPWVEDEHGTPWRGAPAVFGGGVINMTKCTRDGLALGSIALALAYLLVPLRLYLLMR